MTEERKIILEMLKNTDITVEEAERLLDAVEDDESTDTAPMLYGRKPKRIVIQVFEDDKRVVNLRIPLSLALFALKKFAVLERPEGVDENGKRYGGVLDGMDIPKMLDELDYNEISLPYSLVDVDDDDAKVLIVLE